jgi:hypothetical protein
VGEAFVAGPVIAVVVGGHGGAAAYRAGPARNRLAWAVRLLHDAERIARSITGESPKEAMLSDAATALGPRRELRRRDPRLVRLIYPSYPFSEFLVPDLDRLFATRDG